MVRSKEEFWNEDSTNEDWPESTPIKDYYKGKTVFLTGVTGCVGRLILEKLIRLDAGKIYLHIREKKGLSSADRLHKLCKDVTMERATKYNPKFMENIVIVEGDLEYPNLGISDRFIEEIKNEVEIVLAVAADVRFTQPLRQAVNINIRSVCDLLKIAEKMRKLESFMFMSTAYTTNALFGEEKFYSLPINPEVLLKFASRTDECSDEDTQVITEKIIEPWGNTYTFTKNIAEYLVLQYKEKLPVAIIRPSIIIGTVKEPITGWIGNLYGVNGVIVGHTVGIVHVIFTNNDYVGDIIPGDYVSNATLALVYFTTTDSQKSKTRTEDFEPIYNCVSSTDNPQTWGAINRETKYLHDFPTMHSFWYPTSKVVTNWTLFKFFNFLYHVIPAFFVDKVLAWRGEKMRLMQIYRTIFHNIHTSSVFIKNYKFDNSKMRSILNRITDDDYKVFPCDIRNVSWKDYNHGYYLGIRKMWLKDPLSTLPKARKRMLKLQIAHYIVRTVYFCLIGYAYYVLLKFFGAFDYLERFGFSQYFVRH